MKVAVTTPTGNIGSVVTDKLLAAGADVTLLVRDPGKVKAFADRGAKAVAGSLDDAEYVTLATRGADCLFWLTPPNYAAPDFRGYQNEVGRCAAAAVKSNGISRVVHLSSLGAHLDSGTGPILGLRDIEGMFADTGAHVTNLRPGMFMENHLMSLPTILEAGSVFLPVPGTLRANFIA
ncbi:MAG TPA: NAD(P)H-binding protein, partial [bacterium]|nr:NAD(P)H-binding protein [bacterium]